MGGQRIKSAGPAAPPLAAAPPPPPHLQPAAAAYWRRLAPLLVELRLLTALHLESLEALCDAWHEYTRLRDWLAEDPARETFCTDRGYCAETPQVRLRDRALGRLERLWRQFGLTPAALARLGRHGGGSAVEELLRHAAAKYADPSAPH